MGAVYTWLDEGVQVGVSYYYTLKELDVYGRSTLHGPVWAIATAPTARVIYLPFVSK